MATKIFTEKFLTFFREFAFLYFIIINICFMNSNPQIKTSGEVALEQFRYDMNLEIVSFWQPEWKVTQERVRKASNRALSSPEELWAVACAYFDHVQKSPIQRKEYIKTGPLAGTEYTVETPRPFSWSGLSVYASMIGVATNLHRYARNDNDMFTEYQSVVQLINDVMFSQKFEGAAIGMYKENIISREIGLADKSQTEVVLDQPLFNIPE